MDDPFRKQFEVGDLIVPAKYQGHIFSALGYGEPFTVIEIHQTSGKWLLQLSDTKGKARKDASWYQYRFEKVCIGYNPEQTGDTDDDI
jgi:hypothetical protein